MGADTENKLVVFNEIRAEIAKIKEKNADLTFDYEDPAGEKEARSHVFKLRRTKSQITGIHKTAKADALAHCRAVDTEKNWLFKEVDDMVDVHMKPINEIANRKRVAELAKIEAGRIEKERLEQERLDAIAKREEEADRKEAELKAKEEATRKAEEDRVARAKAEEEVRLAGIKAEEDARIAKVKAEEDARNTKAKAENDRLAAERAKFEAEKKAEEDARNREAKAREQAEQDKKDAAAKAEADKEAAVEAEKEKARQTERDRLAKIEAEKVEERRLAEEERKRTEAQEHRARIETEALAAIGRITGDSVDPIEMSVRLLAAIMDGDIPNVTINY